MRRCVGELFTATADRTKSKTELYIVVTPHVVRHGLANVAGSRRRSHRRRGRDGPQHAAALRSPRRRGKRAAMIPARRPKLMLAALALLASGCATAERVSAAGDVHALLIAIRDNDHAAFDARVDRPALEHQLEARILDRTPRAPGRRLRDEGAPARLWPDHWRGWPAIPCCGRKCSRRWRNTTATGPKRRCQVNWSSLGRCGRCRTAGSAPPRATGGRACSPSPTSRAPGGW